MRSFSFVLRASAGDETASFCSFTDFSPVADVSLQVTVTARVSKVGALRVGDADATALLAETGLGADDIANKMTIVVPARQSVVAYLPESSGHGGHRHGSHEQEN